jgi:hypothetical protein
MNLYNFIIYKDGERILESIYADSVKEAKEAIKSEYGKCRIYID